MEGQKMNKESAQVGLRVQTSTKPIDLIINCLRPISALQLAKLVACPAAGLAIGHSLGSFGRFPNTERAKITVQGLEQEVMFVARKDLDEQGERDYIEEWQVDDRCRGGCWQVH